MDLQKLRQHCLDKKGSKEEFPFGEEVHVMKVGGKMFALLSERQSTVEISLKCEPELSDLLRKQYSAVKPGYHLNKRHWNTIEVDGSVPTEELLGWIELSYQLVFKGLKKSERDLISGS